MHDQLWSLASETSSYLHTLLESSRDLPPEAAQSVLSLASELANLQHNILAQLDHLSLATTLRSFEVPTPEAINGSLGQRLNLAPPALAAPGGSGANIFYLADRAKMLPE